MVNPKISESEFGEITQIILDFINSSRVQHYLRRSPDHTRLLMEFFINIIFHQDWILKTGVIGILDLIKFNLIKKIDEESVKKKVEVETF